MTTYTYESIAVYSELGGSVRIAGGARAFVTDPTTGLPVNATQGAVVAPYVDADATGNVSFTAESWPVRLTSGTTYEDVWPVDAAGPADATVAGLIGAATATRTALDGRYVTDAEADATVAALVPAATATRTALDARYLNAVNVKDFGATGDGTTDDTAAIQAAIDAAISTGVRRVYAQDVHIISGSGDMLTATEGIEFFGPGTLRVKNANGPWKSMFTTALNDASGLHIHGLTWDGNATNNQPVAGDVVAGHYPAATRRIMVRCDNGVGMRIEGCTFYDHDGEWAIISASDGTAADIRVLNNQFLKMGNLVDPALVHDHSTIYIDAIGFEIAGNTFSAYEAGVTTGLISYGAISNVDTHGSGQKIHHNLTIGYLFAGQLSTSPYRANTGIHWHHNVALSCGTGIMVTPYTYPMTDVLIEHNDHELNYLTWKVHPWYQGGSGLVMYSTNGAACTNVRITDNAFHWVEATHTGQTLTGSGFQATGIRWSRGESGGAAQDRNFTISRNLIVGAPNNGLMLQFSNIDGLDVSDNVVTDANSTADASTTYGVAIYVDAATSVTRAQVERNQIRDTQSATRSPYGNAVATISAGLSLWYSLGYMRGANGNTLSATTGWVPLLRELDKTVHEPPPLRSTRSYVTEHVTRTTLAVTADVAYFMPIRLGHGALTQVAVEVVTAAAGSSIEAALYTDAAGLPGRKTYSMGTIDSTLTSWRATTAGVYPVQPGIYWIAVVAHGGTPTLRVGTGRASLVRAVAFGGVTSTDLTGVAATGMTSLPTTAPAPSTYGQAPVAYAVGA